MLISFLSDLWVMMSSREGWQHAPADGVCALENDRSEKTVLGKSGRAVVPELEDLFLVPTLRVQVLGDTGHQ